MTTAELRTMLDGMGVDHSGTSDDLVFGQVLDQIEHVGGSADDYTGDVAEGLTLRAKLREGWHWRIESAWSLEELRKAAGG